jgi:hypothetical protein
MGQRGQSTLEWVIGAAVILGTLASQRDHPSNHGARVGPKGESNVPKVEVAGSIPVSRFHRAVVD